MERFKLSYNRSKRQKFIMVIAAILVFVTTYALILPAITIDTDTAEKEPGMVLADENAAEIEAAQMPAVSLKETVGDFTVSVEADAGVFPVNTSLVVNEQQNEVLLPLLEATVESKVDRYDAVQIAFEDENGDPVTPQNTYTVKMSSDAIQGSADRALVQVNNDNETASVVEAPDFTFKQVQFTADTDATFAIVEKSELTSEYLSANGSLYEVTVTYDYTAKIPEGAKLEITEYPEGSSVYETSRRAFLASAEEEQPEAENELFMDIFDLTIRGADLSIIEPASPVQVSIKRKNLPDTFDSQDGGILVQHLNESSGTPFVETMDSAVLLSGDTLTASFQTDSFSTYSLSWRSGYSNYGNSTVHYGYMENNRFVEFPSGTPAHTPEFASTNNYQSEYAYLIQDIPGYKYSSTHLSSATGTKIAPLLNRARTSNYVAAYGNYRYTTSFSTNTPNWSNLSSGSNIYVIYEPDNSQPTPGGTPTIYESEIVNPDDPAMHKTSVNNYDGTRTISLSVDGHATPVEVEKLADVIVIFDVSGSMGNDMDGNSTNVEADKRINIGKDALKKLANDLLSDEYKNKEGNPQIRMSLITFSNTAQEMPFSVLPNYLTDKDGKPMNQSDDQIIVNGSSWQPYPDMNFTSNPEKFGALVDMANAGGGTNWEQALKIANEMPVDPERETFVIFVSDGDPTFRVTRDPTAAVTDAAMESDCDENYYRAYSVFGHGSSDPYGYNYDAALIQAQSIVEQGKQLYGIAIGSVSKMERLTSEAGAGSGHSFAASNREQLEAAFEDIKTEITGHIGWSDVGVYDEITGMTNLSAKANLVGANHGVDDTDIYYTKIIKDDDGNVIQTIENWDPTAEKPTPCGLAHFNAATGALEWNMGDDFQLADNTTYVVNFKVWPNQRAIDIVTQLNNGEITLDDLPEEERNQIDVQTNGEYSVYTLRTNNDAGMTYTPTRYSKAEGTIILDSEKSLRCEDPVEPLVMQTMPLRVHKEFSDSFGDETGDGVGADRPSEVVLYLQRREIGVPNAQWEDVNIFEQPDGTRSNKIVLNDANGWQTETPFYVAPGLKDADGITREVGHEYRVLEPGVDYHYELDGEKINPIMVGYDDFVERDYDPALVELRDVYVVKVYNGDIDESTDLSAINVVKGGINLKKYVIDGTGEVIPNNTESFTIKGWILDPEGNPYTFDPALDDRADKSLRATDATPLFKQHQNDPVPYHFYDANNQRVIYKGHFADTSDIEFTIKSGEQIRFPILPIGSTYSFWEVDDNGMPTGYMLDSAVGVVQENLPDPSTGQYSFVNSADTSLYPVTDENNHITGFISGNKLQVLEFRNRLVRPGSIIIKKTVTKSDGETELWPDDQFTFTGRIRNGSSGVTVPYIIKDKNGAEVSHGTFTNTYSNNSISFRLRAGEYIEIQDVPNNATYRFEEAALAADSGYSFVSVSGTASSAVGANVANPPTVPANNPRRMQGTMHSNEEHDILYTNMISQDPTELRILKVDASDSSVKVSGATFMLYTDPNHTTTAVDYRGDPIGEITTGANGIGYIGNIWPGTYYLVETHPPDHYLPLSDHVIINVGNDGAVTVTNPDNAAATGNGSVPAINGLVTVAIPNTHEHTEPLPHTGGPGTPLIYISGGLLILAAALIYIFSFRRRKGGKRRPEFP